MSTTEEPTNLDPRGRSVETSALVARLGDVSVLHLDVVDVLSVTPAMRRLRLAGHDLVDFEYQPGQDLMVAVPANDGTTYRRRYTIRRIDRTTDILDLDIVEHGEGPGARWAASAQTGDHVEAIGPRGKITLDPDADWHLFVGDESALPASYAMVEGLPPGGRALVLLEVPTAADEQVLGVPAGCEVELVVVTRDGERAGDAGRLLAALSDQRFPEGTGHAYVAGELKVAAAIRGALLERGLGADQISSKPYWRRGVANAAHGEPEKS